MRKLTVTAVNSYIKAVLTSDSNLMNLCVEGEISNFKLHSSGHCYFTLKDAGGVLKCVMFRTAASRLKFRPEDGMKVEAVGCISVYERDGSYQLYVDAMKQGGVGNLYERFEIIKKKLEEEGLFSPRYKKELPKLPKIVGVVTSPTGAVFQDIKNVTYRRFPDMRIRLFPVSVQGEDASPSIVNALKFINRHKLCDVIILGRGGGSIEDLWAFNEEETVRAIFESEIPVVSAVGHETDYTLADFVADLRAPTPSAAAELAVPVFSDLKSILNEYRTKLGVSPRKNIELKRKDLQLIKDNVLFKRPDEIVNSKRQLIDDFSLQLDNLIKFKYKDSTSKFKIISAKLNAMDPMKVLDRGYSVVRNAEGKVITDGNLLETGERFSVTVKGKSFEGSKI